MKDLFLNLYFSPTENELHEIIKSEDIFQNPNNWYPLGGNENNFGIVENQQSSPIASLVEKLTNSIDAILIKKCLEFGIDPRSPQTPQTMQEAIEKFFKEDYQNWNLPSFAKKEAENIQIIADGPKDNTSLIIYDNGEGQHPEDFEKTFLSLLRGNKNDIKFVQGKYNMGGTGALVFCGHHRYQLIGSKKFTNNGKFGFTLIRQHPFTEEEAQIKKNTWYEYFKIEGEIPSFEIDELDLGIFNRKFKTGTVIKLYSYNLPPGNKLISRDLNRSLNEYLFEPALPILTVEKENRYPNDKNLQRQFYGLKRRLENENKYVEDFFTLKYQDDKIGETEITSYVFKVKVENKNVKETKDTIKNEFFKNNMYVLFSVNGQVHGFYTSEFTTRSLKLPLLKNYLLIHVNCTKMNYDFRKELFMGSRDRLKDSEESRYLRKILAEQLRQSRLIDIHKNRKNQISIESEDANELLKSFTKNLPLNDDLLRLLNNTFKLEEKTHQKNKEKEKKENIKNKEKKEEIEEFKPKRFPSFFKFKGNKYEGKNAVKIPLNGSKTLYFETDVEDHYFDRSEDKGDIEVSLLEPSENKKSGGDAIGSPKKISDIFKVTISSPNNGIIKVHLSPKEEVNVGDNIPIKISLKSPEKDFEEIIWIEIDLKQEKSKKENEEEFQNIGLPKYHLVVKEKQDNENYLTWEEIEESGKIMDYETVICLVSDNDFLSDVYINLDSKVLKNYKSKLKTEEQKILAEKKYIASVYFHSIFLYTITKKRHYKIELDNEIEIDEYIEDIFKNYYASFILNFDTGNLIDMLSD